MVEVGELVARVRRVGDERKKDGGARKRGKKAGEARYVQETVAGE